jgi:DNA-binding LacI/PurR family transcriptional regulator
LGILTRVPQSIGTRPISELIHGVQTVASALHSATLLINTPPEVWRPEKASSLGGVIVIPQGVTAADLEIITTRNLPYYIFTESELPGARIFFRQRAAARKVTEELLKLGHRRFAILSGYEAMLDTTKRAGIHEALRDAGIDPAQVPEIVVQRDESKIFQTAREVLNLKPRPTAVIATDDSFAAVLDLEARRSGHLKVPEDISIVGFHAWPFLEHREQPLTTTRFDFFAGGQKAAEGLISASLTGEAPKDIALEPTFHPGTTIGPAPKE